MSILYNRIAIIALLYAILQSLISFSIISNGGIGIHGGLFHVTNITQVFHIFLYFISILILQLTSFYPRKVWVAEHSSLKDLFLNKFVYYRTKIINKMGEHLKIIEYPLILLFIISGAVFLMSTNDFISIFLSIELQSYGLYLLSTIYRNSELSTTGGLIYFLLGGLSSCFILLGTSLLYANSGTTNMDSLYVITSISDLNNYGNSWYNDDYINFSLLIFTIGFLFKVSAAPFHFWSPDVYDAIPTIVTTFVAIVAKISIFIFLLELVYYTNHYLFNFNWTYGLLVSSLLSLIVGTVLGLTQFRIKRLLAYSTISHLGFILLALTISSVESTQAFIFYLMQYSISNLNVFIILVTIGFSLYCYVNDSKEDKELLDKNNSPIQLISQLKGYFYINPMLALSFAITIFSFAGIPPLMGFFAKQMVLSAALDNGYIFLSLIAIITSVIGAVYYLTIVKEMFFFSSEYKINPLLSTQSDLKGRIYAKGSGSASVASAESIKFNHNNIVMSSPMAITISIISLAILLFIFMNKEWLSMGAINLLFFLCAMELASVLACNLLLLLNTLIKSYTYLISSLKSYLSMYNLLYGTKGCSNVLVNLTPSLSRGAGHSAITASPTGGPSIRYMIRLYSVLPQQTLRYSSTTTLHHNKTQSISPWFISGYSDAEGCFNVGLQKNPNGKFYVRPSFLIQVHSRDNELLMQIKDYFGGIGNIYTSKDKSRFTVRSLDEILKVIRHFDNYPLITQKKADFILFKQIIDKVIEGEHLSAKGLQEIVNIRASINLGLSDSLKTIFPDTVPVTRPQIANTTIPHPEWMAGFVSGEGCFLVQLAKYGKGKLDGVSLSFKVSQHLRDKSLLNSFILFFGCGLFNYHSGKSKLGSGVFIVRKFADISDKILPFFKEHEIRGIKREDFEDWVKVVELIRSKVHLTEEGVEKIRKIKSGMNTLR
jgi:NADH-ubiquinone oxidoreductase chain 2